MRCCPRPTLVAAIAFACLTMPADAAASERVLVVGADAALVHDAVAASSTPRELATRFSPAGLAQLAMDSLGLPTGSLVRLASDPSAAAAQTQLLVQSPVQADLFARVDAYAMVFVDSADADVLTTLNAASSSGYHKIFELAPDAAAGPSTTIPAVIASALTDAVGARVQCAGSDVVCAGTTLAATKASASQLASVLKQYSFLDATLSADRALAEELAQTQQLSASITSGDKKTSPTAFLAVSFESVSALLGTDKQTRARRAIATELQTLLMALQQSYPHSSGAQVVATSRAATNSVVQQMTVTAPASPLHVVDSIVAYGRMLLSFQEKVGSASDDDDDDDDDDDSDLGAGANVTKSDITMEDIAEYQIVLWTSVLLGAVLILVILAMCNMNNKRDSLLYAKFTTSNGGRKFD